MLSQNVYIMVTTIYSDQCKKSKNRIHEISYLKYYAIYCLTMEFNKKLNINKSRLRSLFIIPIKYLYDTSVDNNISFLIYYLITS